VVDTPPVVGNGRKDDRYAPDCVDRTVKVQELEGFVLDDTVLDFVTVTKVVQLRRQSKKRIIRMNPRKESKKRIQERNPRKESLEGIQEQNPKIRNILVENELTDEEDMSRNKRAPSA